MKTLEEQQEVAVDASQKMLPLTQIVIAIWQRRFWLAKVVGAGSLIIFGLSWLNPNQYSSTARLMPPDWRPPSGDLMLGALSGGSAEGGEGLAEALMGNKTPGAIYIGILESETVQEAIVRRFDLRSVYHRKLDVDARSALSANTDIVEDKKSGIITITVTDKDRYLARNIADAYVQELDNLVDGLSTSSARRERVFLEGRLKSIKADLDTNSQALSQFSARTATLDLQKQGEATMEAAGKLEGELITAQSQLSALKAAYSNDNVRVREAQGRVNALQAQLRIMTGAGKSGAGAAAADSDQSLPSVRELPVLGLTYYDLSRKVTMDEALYETLTKQYELARVEEAEQILPIEVLDAPSVAERKSGPHRSHTLFFSFIFFLFAGTAWIAASTIWEMTDDAHPAKAFGIIVLRSIRRRKSAGSN